jgi:hypothetical protein
MIRSPEMRKTFSAVHRIFHRIETRKLRRGKKFPFLHGGGKAFMGPVANPPSALP